MRSTSVMDAHRKGIYVLGTDASVVAISGILHQEQEWNGKTVLRPIAYGSKVLSDTVMKYRAPKAEMFALVTANISAKNTGHTWVARGSSYESTTEHSVG